MLLQADCKSGVIDGTCIRSNPAVIDVASGYHSEMDEISSVAASYRHVRRISRRSGSNFYRSFWLLPKPKREAMCALYAFARTTDDLGDCEEPIALRTLWLGWWRQTVALNLLRDVSSEQVILPEGLIQN